jgi:hypothetical protein
LPAETLDRFAEEPISIGLSSIHGAGPENNWFGIEIRRDFAPQCAFRLTVNASGELVNGWTVRADGWDDAAGTPTPDQFFLDDLPPRQSADSTGRSDASDSK